MKNKRFHMFVIKNTIAITLPAIGVFLVLIFMFMKYPVFDRVRTNKMGNIEHVGDRLATLYASDTRNVEYTAHDLYYTGFQYHVDDKMKGAYYYSIQGDELLLYLVETKDPKIHIDKLTVKGRIVKDASSTEYIMSQLAAQSGMDVQLLKQYACVYIISEPDYPRAFITMLYVIFFLPVVLCILIFSYTLLVWVQPALHSQVRQLAVYGDPAVMIKEINAELAYHLLFHYNNIYITDNYMIISHITKTEVIKLDYVKYLSKNLVEKKRLFHKDGFVYRLTMSNPDKLFCEVDFTSEELIDQVVFYIRGEKA